MNRRAVGKREDWRFVFERRSVNCEEEKGNETVSFELLHEEAER